MVRLRAKDILYGFGEVGEICKVAAYLFLLPIIFTFLEIRRYLPDIHEFFLHLIAFIIPSLVSYLLYKISKRFKRDDIKLKHILIAVGIIWLLIPLIGSLPFIITGTLSPVKAFFESMSGWTTTGMTMIQHPQDLPKDILFFRGLIQWIGGIGVVALALAIFMREGTVAMKYYSSEVGKQKLKPSTRSTINETWKIYLIYTLACTLLLIILGMTPFDALLHSFTALSTGGFSTHEESVAYYRAIFPVYQSFMIELVLIIFMIIGATSFLIHFNIFKGNFDTLLKNIEFKYLFILIFLVSLIILILSPNQTSAFDEIRDIIFHVTSAITCTGFSTAPLENWSEPSLALLIFLMYIGGIYGSTSGGIKLLRFIAILKTIEYMITRIALPKTIVRAIKIQEKTLEMEEIFEILILAILYISFAFLGSIILAALTNFSFLSSMFLVFSAMSNVGLISVPSDMWFSMQDSAIITLAMLMWIGRLEIFPVLIIIMSIFSFKIKKRKIPFRRPL
ncbi:MAG TPA: TrkH family potassium uptake protein [Candidatus Altiarchaeales archaeon]|nr:TrkH family potassium uptake protein [Candidatus Altiarchaeales archaeon]